MATPEQSLQQVIISEFIKAIISEAKPWFEDLKDELAFFLNDGLPKYLEKQNNYAYIKTLLHRGTDAVYLYDVYQPLRLRTDDNKTRIDTASVKELVTNGHCVTIIGDAGSGKSVLVKHLLLTSIREKAGIPMLIELRDLSNLKDDLENYIIKRVLENKLAPNEGISQRILENGKFIFFLDGYDEIKSDIKKTVLLSLNNFIAKYDKNKYFLTSRPYTNIELLPLFKKYFVDKLSDKDIDQFVRKQVKVTLLADKIIKSIKEGKAAYIKSFLTNPLLLSLYILTFQSYSTIPDKKYLFYRRVIEALFSQHDSLTKLGYERERVSMLTQEQFEEILKRFSFLTYFDGLYHFEKDYLNTVFKKIKEKVEIKFDNEKLITDLQVGTALWVDDGGVVSFAHRSLQEYFAALYIKDLSNEHKKVVYQKVYMKILDRKIREIDNFLSLCEEMDEINYIFYFALPVLRETLKRLHRDSVGETIKAVLAIVIGRILVEYSGKKSGSKRSGPATSLHFLTDSGESFFLSIDPKCNEQRRQTVSDFVLSLSNDNIKTMIMKKNIQDDFLDPDFKVFFSKIDFSKFFAIDLAKSADDEFVSSFISNTTFPQSVEGLLKCLKDRIIEYELLIDQRDKADEDLISLI